MSRYTQGEMLANKQMVQEMIADSWMEIEAFRLLTLQTAWKIDQYNDYKAVRADISAVKAMMQKVLHDVSARALQLHGSLGTTHEMPFVQYLVESFVLGLADGPTEVHKVTLARLLLKDVQAGARRCFPSEHLLRLRRGRRGEVRRQARGHPAGLTPGGPQCTCDGKVALVTGSSRGLGKAIAQRLAGEGATVALTARTMEPDPKYQGSLRQTLEEIEAAGGSAIAVAGRPVERRGPRATVRRGGRADRRARHPGQQRRGHVPASARRVSRPAGAADDGDARAGAAAPDPAGDPRHARARPRLGAERDVGRRRSARRARRSPNSTATAGFGVYGTVKAALNRLTKSLAAELYDDGIAVNAAAPSNPVATAGAGTLDLAKTDTEDIELITQTAFVLCTGDPKTMTGRIAHTQPFLREIGWLR